MSFARIDGLFLHHRFRPGRGRAVVFLNSLGTDLRIWDAVIDALPACLPVLGMDARGHGLSQTAPASVERLADDVAALMTCHGIETALVCGVSLGGLVAQALALAHADRVSGLVLSNTAARIGDAASWQARLDALAHGGLESMADAVVERWFSSAYRHEWPTAAAGYRAMLVRTPLEGYADACRALRDCDLRHRLGGIDVPTLCIAGERDEATPPATVRELAAGIRGARCVEIASVGHLPCVEVPDVVAGHVTDLLGRLP